MPDACIAFAALICLGGLAAVGVGIVVLISALVLRHSTSRGPWPVPPWWWGDGFGGSGGGS
jgi:hypothetical protein